MNLCASTTYEYKQSVVIRWQRIFEADHVRHRSIRWSDGARNWIERGSIWRSVVVKLVGRKDCIVLHAIIRVSGIFCILQRSRMLQFCSVSSWTYMLNNKLMRVLLTFFPQVPKLVEAWGANQNLDRPKTARPESRPILTTRSPGIEQNLCHAIMRHHHLKHWGCKTGNSRIKDARSLWQRKRLNETTVTQHELFTSVQVSSSWRVVATSHKCCGFWR